jgi:hypothetical protein
MTNATQKVDVTPAMRRALFPTIVIPEGLTFEDLERGGEMVFAWQRADDEFSEDFRGLKLVAKLYEYLRAKVAARSGTK